VIRSFATSWTHRDGAVAWPCRPAQALIGEVSSNATKAARTARIVTSGLWVPNALASAARAPSKSQTDARAWRPCRLHAVIRRLAAHGQRDLDRAPASSPTTPHALLGRRAARCWSVARDAGGRGRGPAASRLRLHPSVGLRTSVGTERPRPTPTLRLPRLPGARRRRWLGWLPATHLKVVVPA
jgi:hypothetical protein